MDGLWEMAASCGACGGDAWRPEFAIHSRRYGRCSSCGVVRLIDRVASDRLALLYDDYYADQPVTGGALERDLANPTFAARRRRLEAAIGSRARRLFEVGCGDGNFLLALQRAGWAVSGSEHGATAAMVERRHGIPTSGIDVMDAVPPGAPFPAVAAYHVLEHLYRPAAWLAVMRDLVEPGGILHLQVPNYDSLTRRLAGESWASWVFPQHVFFYTPSTLQGFLEREGFTVERASTWDPWHGPGAATASCAQRVRALAGGGSPWQQDVRSQPATPAPRVPPARRSAIGRLPHALLSAAGGAWSRVEALAGRGAVVDVIARRR